MYANPNMAKAMHYHTNYHEESNSKQSAINDRCSSSPPHPNNPPSSQLKDIFDSQHYHHLCEEQ